MSSDQDGGRSRRGESLGWGVVELRRPNRFTWARAGADAARPARHLLAAAAVLVGKPTSLDRTSSFQQTSVPGRRVRPDPLLSRQIV